MRLRITIIASTMATQSRLQALFSDIDGVSTCVAELRPDLGVRPIRSADILLLDHELEQETILPL